MNIPNTARLSLGHQIAAAYTPNPNIVAVLVGSSTARGSADHCSDFEMGQILG